MVLSSLSPLLIRQAAKKGVSQWMGVKVLTQKEKKYLSILNFNILHFLSKHFLPGVQVVQKVVAAHSEALQALRITINIQSVSPSVIRNYDPFLNHSQVLGLLSLERRRRNKKERKRVIEVSTSSNWKLKNRTVKYYCY